MLEVGKYDKLALVALIYFLSINFKGWVFC